MSEQNANDEAVPPPSAVPAPVASVEKSNEPTKRTIDIANATATDHANVKAKLVEQLEASVKSTRAIHEAAINEGMRAEKLAKMARTEFEATKSLGERAKLDLSRLELRPPKMDVVKLNEQFGIIGENVRATYIGPRIPINPLARVREEEEQNEKWANRVDEFVRWAYSEKSRRKKVFDGRKFGPDTKREEKDAMGIMAQAIIAGHFILDGYPDIKDQPEDSKRKASEWCGTLVRRHPRDGVAITIRFTEPGLEYATALWWQDRTKRYKRAHRVWKVSRKLFLWLSIFLAGLLTNVENFQKLWKLVTHPKTVIQGDDANTQQPTEKR